MRVALTIAAFLATSVAFAREVYMNGVKLDANVVLKAQTLSGCEVRFDERGDVYITAKGYNIATAPVSRPSTPAPPPPPPSAPSAPPPAAPRENFVNLTKKGVWLVSKQTQRGIVQYDVDVYVNESFVRKVKSVEDPVVVDITKWIHAGENRVRMEAKKNAPEKRNSLSPTDTMEVILGEGVLGGSQVAIDKVLVDFKRTAQETEPIIEEFSITAR